MLDNEATHKNTKVKEKLKECETPFPMISSDLTSELQTFYISINKAL